MVKSFLDNRGEQRAKLFPESDKKFCCPTTRAWRCILLQRIEGRKQFVFRYWTVAVSSLLISDCWHMLKKVRIAIIRQIDVGLIKAGIKLFTFLQYLFHITGDASVR